MKQLKKFGALIIALALVLSMGMTALGAETNTLTKGKAGELYESQNEGAKITNTLTFPKEIVLYNTTSAEVHYPAIQYEYSIEGTIGTNATVTDGDGDQGVVYDGVTAAVSISSPVVFSNAASQTAVTPDGKIASMPITVTVNPSQFEHAGIYRYLITETNNSDARTAAGVARGDNYVNKRYLDIYVRRAVAADNVSTAYVVYGYVLFKGTDASISKAETEVTKSQGFVATADGNIYSTADVDYYETYNLKVTKNIEGTLAETTHGFPFSVAFTSPVTTDAVIEWAKGTATTDEATITNKALTLGDATTSGYSNSEINLADSEYVTIYGIPAGTTAVVSEINDTYDVYTASQKSIAGGTSTAPDAINLAANHGTASIYSITAIANATTTTNNSKADTELQVKNEMAVVSPTGVVMRFAPYALILAAGIVLMVLALRRRSHKEDEE